jgi:hypothetical protein
MTYTRKPRSYERGLDSRGGCPYVVLAGSNKNPHPSAKNALGWGTRPETDEKKRKPQGPQGFTGEIGDLIRVSLGKGEAATATI